MVERVGVSRTILYDTRGLVVEVTEELSDLYDSSSTL